MTQKEEEEEEEEEVMVVVVAVLEDVMMLKCFSMFHSDSILKHFVYLFDTIRQQ